MAQRQIMPAAIEYSRRLAEACQAVKQAGGNAETQIKTMNEICEQIDALRKGIEGMVEVLAEVEPIVEADERALQARNKVIPQLAALREPADQLETLVDAELWPLPTYAEMVFKR
jgi:glutamine synthetase